MTSTAEKAVLNIIKSVVDLDTSSLIAPIPHAVHAALKSIWPGSVALASDVLVLKKCVNCGLGHKLTSDLCAKRNEAVAASKEALRNSLLRHRVPWYHNIPENNGKRYAQFTDKGERIV